MRLIVAARSSPLSKVQVIEVQKELNLFHPHLSFEHLMIETTGDKNQQISLRGQEKTNFFTKEIDEALLSVRSNIPICDIAIHSAKDLPDPLDPRLTIAAITQGIDNSDSLVINQGYTLEMMPQGALIATSSERREANVKALRSDFTFRDCRGTIEQRLLLLTSGQVDGIVIAEAAIQRLGLTHLTRIKLPGTTTPLQGQLAIVTRREDFALLNLFSCIDSRQK